MTMYLDLDGVLANMEGYLQEHYGDKWKEEIEKPNWGDVGASHQRIYSKLEPMPDAHQLVKDLRFWFDDIRILTAIPKRAHFPHAVNDKRDWVHKHFGSDMKVHFGPYAYDKQFHCQPGDYLIDDMKINIEQWNAVGGYGILHTSAEDSIRQFCEHFIGRAKNDTKIL